MSSFYGICDLKREKICTEKLQIFLGDFFRHSKVFSEIVAELKQLIARIESLSSKIVTLEKYVDCRAYESIMKI